jgi:L-asparaginase
MITLLAAGGTIAMRGDHAVPALDAEGLVAAVPELAAHDVQVRDVSTLPGALLSLDDLLAIARAATEAAGGGRGVVVTHGTDTIEETALLCDLLHAGAAPIVVTGAIRPASAAGADGPANLLAACATAAAPEARGLGALVAFAGELHAARWARKVRATSPVAFGSPALGPVGWVDENRVRVAARPARGPRLDVARLDFRIPVLLFGAGDRGEGAADAAARADGLVAVVPGAGHAHPELLATLDALTARMPVVAASRPDQGRILRETYGFAGSERDLRASGLIPAGALSPSAARIALLACLGAGADPGEVLPALGEP